MTARTPSVVKIDRTSPADRADSADPHDGDATIRDYEGCTWTTRSLIRNAHPERSVIEFIVRMRKVPATVVDAPQDADPVPVSAEASDQGHSARGADRQRGDGMDIIKRFWKGFSIVSSIVVGIAFVASLILLQDRRVMVYVLVPFIVWSLVMPFLAGLFGESARQSAQE
jgi:hypothetical protein